MNAGGKSDNKPGRKNDQVEGKENRIEKQITKLSTEKLFQRNQTKMLSISNVLFFRNNSTTFNDWIKCY